MKNSFSTISSINLDDSQSWQDPLFITLDIDWCHDDVLSYSINLLEQADASATWFVTHDTPLLERLRTNPKFELGIHPNFNFLLQGDGRNGRDAEEVVDRVLEIVPEATSVRSHSMTQSSVLLNLFYQKGLRYDCNDFIPFQENFQLRPYRIWNNLIKVPYSWEDDIACIKNEHCLEMITNRVEGLNVFDFHPIHIFLNTNDLSVYESTRDIHNLPDKLSRVRWQKEGTQSWLEELLAK